MERIGVRELRQHASRWLALAASGETIQITDRGQLVALLTPPGEARPWERLKQQGRIIPATADLLDIPPLPPDGRPSPSDLLEQQRSDER